MLGTWRVIWEPGVATSTSSRSSAFLRDQSLNYRRQVAFAERLGPLTLGHPTLASPPGQPLLEEIDSLKGGKANYWHTDVTFVDRPPAFTLLHAVVIPPVGGDTQWANTVSAYQSLPPELRDLADRLRVLHTNDFDYARTVLTSGNRGERVDPALAAAHEEFVSTVYETVHPLVRVHPETSERSLVLGGFARTVLGFTPQASRDLIRVLQDYITRPEHTVRWALAPGRPGHLGQPRHPALRDRGLWRRPPSRRARHRGRASTGRGGRSAERRGQGRCLGLLRRRPEPLTGGTA
jgi:alpha-ketoglutarate-dependent taurine dioxygenase